MYCGFGCLILCELENLGLVAELFGRSLADPDVLDPRRSMSAPLHVSRPTLAGEYKGISISTAKLPRTLERKLTTTGTGYQVIDCVKKRDGKVILHGASHWDIYATARQFSSCCYARRDNSDLRIDPQTPSPRSRQNPTGPQHMKLWAAKEPPVPSSSGSEIGESRPRSVHAKKDQHLGFDWTSHSVVLDVASGWLSCLFLRQEGTRQESANCFR